MNQSLGCIFHCRAGSLIVVRLKMIAAGWPIQRPGEFLKKRLINYAKKLVMLVDYRVFWSLMGFFQEAPEVTSWVSA